MRRWWTDIEAPDRPWSGLHVVLLDVHGAPPLHVVNPSGPGIDVLAHGRRLLHAEVARYYEGVQIERDFAAAAELGHDFPLPPISADDLRAAPVGPRDWQRYWCRWVAERIDAGNFGYASDWAVQIARHGARPSHDWEEHGPLVCNLEHTLDEPASIFKTWMLNGSSHCLAMRGKPAAHEGRVKHWRKQCRADRLPPVVVWWVSGLDCWLLIDGHRRLLAARLEGRLPPTIGVYSFAEKHWPLTSETIERHQFERDARQRHGALSPAAIRELDQRLIQIYDDRPRWVAWTRAWYRR